jgi:hypothetical protein
MNAFDQIPIEGVFVGFMIVTLVAYEVGFRLGRWWQDKMPGEQEGPTDMLVGALVGLMAFVLAITMGMAADRFDARRGLVLSEANAIYATYLQASFLPAPEADQMRELVREYLPLRIGTEDAAQVQANIQRSVQLHDEMWAIFDNVARSGYSPDMVSAFGSTLTELINMNETRIVAGYQSRVPPTIIWLLLIGSTLALGMVGYAAGIRKQRGLLTAVVLILALDIVTVLVIDLDQPTQGLISVSQQPFLDVQRWIGLPKS